MAYQCQETNTITALVVVRTGPVAVGKFHCIAPTANITHFQFFDAAATTAVTLGTTVPRLVLSAPVSSYIMDDPSAPLVFTSGIVCACTTTPLGNTTTNAGHLRLWLE